MVSCIPVRTNQAKRHYALTAAINRLCLMEKFPVFVTLTFAENQTDHKIAVERWNVLWKRVKRRWKGLAMVGVWARQHRGAWHLHLVCSRFLQVTSTSGNPGLREMAVECGFGQQMQLKAIAVSRKGCREYDARKIANYLGGYLQNENSLDPERDKGVRQLIYRGRVCSFNGTEKGICPRVCSLRFYWISSFSALAARGRYLREAVDGPSGVRWGTREAEAEFWLDVRWGYEHLSPAWKRYFAWRPAFRKWLFKNVYKMEDPVCPF